MQADHDAPLTMLSLATTYFPLLTTKEQKYAHFMSLASHAGTRIVLRQVSVESEPLFDLLLHVHKQLNGIYPGDSSLYLDYVSQFLSNLGNYKSFGDSKFIPGCSTDYVLQACTLAGIDLDGQVSQFHAGECDFKTVRDLIAIGMYGTDDNVMLLGFPADNHVSSYYLGKEPISLDDMTLLKNHFFGKYGILPENTRIKKLSANKFEIYVGSINVTNTLPATQYPHGLITLDDPKHTHVSFKFGDHSKEMKLIVENLQQAMNYTANDTQTSMLQHYINHFTSGSGKEHKLAQIDWVKDLAPTIETNIGFIETYREPSGIIGEFESLVAIQNKERTAKFATMVSNAQEFIELLPWSHDFEKEKFNPPDFTSLEVLTFTGSGIPAGINIPNYDDVRLTIGFKNVSLGNILSASAKASSSHPPTFIRDEDLSLFQKYQSDSFEVQVGIHELLGHGSGKLLLQTGDNEYNFDRADAPIGLDGKRVSTYYKLGETWGSVFGSLAGAFEETRAEVVAMYLITNRKLLNIFGFTTTQEQNDVIYAGYLQMARAGLMALEYWDPQSGKWGQPHMQARFSIMKTFLLHCKNNSFLTIEHENNDLKIHLDRSLIETDGLDCVRDYLLHLHVYKCSADFERGSKYYIDRSTVPEELASLRDLVISKRLPRRQFIQANSSLDNVSSTVQLTEYPETPQGMIQSFLERAL